MKAIYCFRRLGTVLWWFTKPHEIKVNVLCVFLSFCMFPSIKGNSIRAYLDTI